MEQGRIDPADGRLLVEAMKRRNLSFDGVSGDVRLNANGDRVGNLVLQDVDGSRFQSVVFYSGRSGALRPYPGTQIHWPGGRVTPDVPECGFRNELVEKPGCLEVSQRQAAARSRGAGALVGSCFLVFLCVLLNSR